MAGRVREALRHLGEREAGVGRIPGGHGPAGHGLATPPEAPPRRTRSDKRGQRSLGLLPRETFEIRMASRHGSSCVIPSPAPEPGLRDHRTGAPGTTSEAFCHVPPVSPPARRRKAASYTRGEPHRWSGLTATGAGCPVHAGRDWSRKGMRADQSGLPRICGKASPGKPGRASRCPSRSPPPRPCRSG